MTTTHRGPGLLIVVSSPSGGGKTTLCRRLVEEFPAAATSVSYTTRQPRGSESNGCEYHFVSDPCFDQMVERREFAEWAEVHGKRYGTSLKTLELAIQQGQDLVFDIDWQGAYQLQDHYPDNTVMVFVLPPSIEELAGRLRRRGTDPPEVIEHRLNAAREEIRHSDRYDYLVVNESLDDAYDQLRSIYRAARTSRQYQRWRLESLLDANC